MSTDFASRDRSDSSIKAGLRIAAHTAAGGADKRNVISAWVAIEAIESTVGARSQADYVLVVADDRAEATCGLCGRVLVPGSSINKHHLIPKTYGGVETAWMHAICHSKVHSVFSERELRDHYHTFEALLAHEEIQKFVRWVRKKEPTFNVRNRPHQRRRR